jgi:hypothetical protein
MPQAMITKQHCSWDHGGRALSILECYFQGIVQSTSVALRYEPYYNRHQFQIYARLYVVLILP